MKIPDQVKSFLEKQHFAIISSIEANNRLHTSAKGIIDINPKGKIFVLDLYKGQTYKNIKKNPNVALTVIDDHNYTGYSIQGKAKITKENTISDKKMKVWHDNLAKRIARRVIRHVKNEVSGHEGIPEARFPIPKHLIEIDVEKIVDLAPHKVKQNQNK